MKSNSVALTKWHTNAKLDQNINIDWPQYHKEVGEDCLAWLLDQERKGRCQLVVEQQSSRARLTVDFFDDKILTQYHLMWG